MKPFSGGTLLMCLLLLASPTLAAPADEQEMLWIDVTSATDPSTTIAISLNVARELYQSERQHLILGHKSHSEKELQQLIADVLDGDQEEGEVYDSEDSTRVRVWKGMAEVPTSGKGNGNTLVVEVRENGKVVTTIRLPNITVETSATDEDAVVETAIGWRTFLPFLAESGGAVYIATGKDDSEVWVYVE